MTRRTKPLDKMVLSRFKALGSASKVSEDLGWSVPVISAIIRRLHGGQTITAIKEGMGLPPGKVPLKRREILEAYRAVMLLKSITEAAYALDLSEGQVHYRLKLGVAAGLVQPVRLKFGRPTSPDSDKV